MTGYDFDWVDAFADRPFGGNGCVVVHGAAALDAGARMALVRETSLSECAYVVPSDRADFGARYYLADREILMAGHPTIATVRSLVHRGLVDLSSGEARFTLEVGAGVLPIRVTLRDGVPLIAMTQARPVFGPWQDAAEVAAIFGLTAGDVAAPPRVVSTGTPFCVVLLQGRAALDRARLDAGRLRDWQARAGVDRLMEPFLATLGGATAGGDTFARLLLAPPLPAEDPFTGSATGCMAAYLWAGGHIPRPDFVAEQGHGLGRPGRAEVSVLGPPDDIAGVVVAGQGVVLMEGRLRL
jgi:PhzF family phenazine biosynthesis protein